MTTVQRRAARGYTLVEMLVTLAVAGVCFTLVMLTFLAQNKGYEGQEVKRLAQESARDATLALERTLRMAGFGVDPRVAFDLRQYRCAAAPCRDRINAPDELVFVSRSPRYQLQPVGPSCLRPEGCLLGEAWHVESAGSTTLRVLGRQGELFRKGQLLLVVCPGATLSTLVTVDANSGPLAADGGVSLALAGAVAGNPYRENNLGDGCFGGGRAMAFKIDRYRYFVDAPATGDTRLMLDAGVDMDLDGTTPEGGDRDDLLPVARGVEDLQVAYVLEPSTSYAAPDLDRDWVIGNTAGSVEEPDPTAPAPDLTTASDDARRSSLHPANVRAVRVSVTARSPRADPSEPPGWTGDRLILQENRNAWTVGRLGLRRASAKTTVTVRNLAARGLTLF